MQQYFIKESLNLHQEFFFDKEQSHHIAKVLRMKNGDVVKVVDILGQPFMASVKIDAKTVSGYVYDALEKQEEERQIILIQGMIKKEKWDFLIQKCCELGVTKIIPMISSRTIVKVDADDTKKLERYNKIALEACEQCKRDSLAKVETPIRFKDIVHHKGDLNLIAYEDIDYPSKKLKVVLDEYKDAKTIVCVIGSEGGFAQEEVLSLVEEGFISISLGKRILRAETAAMNVVGNIQYHFE